MTNPAFHRMQYAGYTLQSQVPLPCLPPAPAPATAGPVRLHIEAPECVDQLPTSIDWQHAWRAHNEGSICLQHVKEGPQLHRLRVPGICDFLVSLDSDPVTVRIEYDREVPPDTLEHLLADQILPRVLSGLGDLIIHASCCSINGNGVLFLGESGWGKSTLASLLQSRGHQLLSDDCVLLQVNGGQVSAVSTYPSLRLFKDSLRNTSLDTPALAPVAPYTPKHRVIQHGWKTMLQAPVHAIFLLNDPGQAVSSISIKKVPPAQACIAMVGQGFRIDLAEPERNIGFLRQTAEVVCKTNVFSISYPRDFRQADALAGQLLVHLGTL